jgi:hypothetical protein
MNKLFVPCFDPQTAKKLRAAMKKLPSSGKTVDKIIGDFCGLTAKEKEEIDTYKTRLLSVERK